MTAGSGESTRPLDVVVRLDSSDPGPERHGAAAGLARVLLGTISSTATPAGLLALSSLAVHRPARLTVVATLLWIPSLLAFAVYSPTTGPVSVVLLLMPLALAAIGWGMFIRARRQLLLSEIAASLFVSEATVKAHVSRLLSKLDVNNRVQIAILVHDAAQA